MVVECALDVPLFWNVPIGSGTRRTDSTLVGAGVTTFIFWRRDKKAGLLLVPYLAWLNFTHDFQFFHLAIELLSLNRGRTILTRIFSARRSPSLAN